MPAARQLEGCGDARTSRLSNMPPGQDQGLRPGNVKFEQKNRSSTWKHRVWGSGKATGGKWNGCRRTKAQEQWRLPGLSPGNSQRWQLRKALLQQHANEPERACFEHSGSTSVLAVTNYGTKSPDFQLLSQPRGRVRRVPPRSST